jgi:hypothetical protein
VSDHAVQAFKLAEALTRRMNIRSLAECPF